MEAYGRAKLFISGLIQKREEEERAGVPQSSSKASDQKTSH
jgi:hypothetical protein